MKPPAGCRLGALLVAALAAALSVADCSAAHLPATAVGHAASHTSGTTARPAATTAASPERRAEADAAAILAAFSAPPGARRLPGPPTGQASQMKDITAGSVSPNWIDKTAFWQVKGGPQQVLGWTASHVVRSHTTETETHPPVPGHPVTVWEHDYVLPPVPGVEDTRELTVEVADAGNGQTAIRVDAQVTWLPARTASEMVPAGATAVELIEIPGGNQKPPRPMTVTSPAAVRGIVAMVNSLPVFPPGPRECGLGGWAFLGLTFLAAPQGSVLATALINDGGCGQVLFAVGAHTITDPPASWTVPGATALGVPWGGQALSAAVLKTAGSKWNLAA